MKFSSREDDTCLSIDMADLTILDHTHEILPLDPLDSFLFKLIINYQEGKIINLWEDDNDEADQYTDSRLFSNKKDEEPTSKPTLFTANTKEPEKFSLEVQPQHRLNPKVQDVVKAEIVRLLNARLIYVGIKRLHDDLGVNTAKVRVTAAKHNLVLLVILVKNILNSYYR
ncbi:hypothetical protein Tco_1443093 [Tanacetum coccineum]